MNEYSNKICEYNRESEREKNRYNISLEKVEEFFSK
jgi:hypothetical protein